jgi:hypothetical protein
VLGGEGFLANDFGDGAMAFVLVHDHGRHPNILFGYMQHIMQPKF